MLIRELILVLRYEELKIRSMPLLSMKYVIDLVLEAGISSVYS